MLVRGVELALHPPGEALSDHIRRENDFFEAELLDFIIDRFPVQRTVIDVGANIGNHTVFFATFLQFYDTIVAFEPVPDNFNLLAQNINGYNGVKAFNYALSDKTRRVKMHVNPQNMGASQITDTGELEIDAYSLDRLYFKNVSLLKIDAEEYEPQILDGAQDTIVRCKPLIIIEDWYEKYKELLPDKYECIKAWEVGKTFVYEWKD